MDPFEEIVCALLLIIMVFVIGVNIVSRYLPGLSFAASEELVVNLFVWLTMMGAVIAVKKNSHLTISFIFKKVPSKFQKTVYAFHWGIIFIVFSLLLFFSAVETWSEYQAGMMTYSLGLPMWMFTLALPVGSLLFLIRYTQMTWLKWKGLS